MRPVRKLARYVLSRGRTAEAFARLTRNAVPVFMMHRFADPETGVTGHSPQVLRKVLTYLRRNRYGIISIGELERRLGPDAEPIQKTVAFAVDDGYADFFHVAAPIFREYDCPVTVFLSTGFLDGTCWMWWDRIFLACRESPRRRAVLDVAGQPVGLDLSDQYARSTTAAEIAARLKTVPEAAKLSVLDNLEAALEIELPDVPPASYAPMTWADVRAAAKGGVTFGAHTVTHPILAQTEDAQAEQEIRESRRRVREETDAFVPIFCYPNGDEGDFSEREIRLLREQGFEGAVTSIFGYAQPADFAPGSEHRRYTLPRICEGPVAKMICTASGAERFLERLARSNARR